MSDECVDLLTRVCPYVVMYIIREAGKIRPHETRTFLVDDPLAIKSVPEEVAEYYNDLDVAIQAYPEGWEIIISRT
jgi:TusA-related sulfurtransferase